MISLALYHYLSWYHHAGKQMMLSSDVGRCSCLRFLFHGIRYQICKKSQNLESSETEARMRSPIVFKKKKKKEEEIPMPQSF